eukprot:12835100-Heterocapsa_arctica.AAC.1
MRIRTTTGPRKMSGTMTGMRISTIPSVPCTAVKILMKKMMVPGGTTTPMTARSRRTKKRWTSCWRPTSKARRPRSV